MYGPVSGGNRTDTAIVFAWLDPRTIKFYEKDKLTTYLVDVFCAGAGLTNITTDDSIENK